MVNPNRRMTQHRIDGKGYFNKHPYNNKESRWCDLNEVPYARNGYLYGPETIEDQITGITYYQIDFYNNTNFYRSFYDGKLDPTILFKEGDTLLIRHQQADVRFKITEFSPRAKNMIGTRYLNVAWQFDSEGWNKYKKEKDIYKYSVNSLTWQDQIAFWTTGSVLAGAQPNKIARAWSWTAVTKETLLKLQLLGYQ